MSTDGRKRAHRHPLGHDQFRCPSRAAAELAATAPDVIVSMIGMTTTGPLLEATRTLSIVFVLLIDPVGAGFVANLARPGGNVNPSNE